MAHARQGKKYYWWPRQGDYRTESLDTWIVVKGPDWTHRIGYICLRNGKYAGYTYWTFDSQITPEFDDLNDCVAAVALLRG